MGDKTFQIVFEKLAEAIAEEGELKALDSELDELAELRRLSLELSSPEPLTFTTS